MKHGSTVILKLIDSGLSVITILLVLQQNALISTEDGHFIATVMTTQAVNEGIFKFVADRNNIPYKSHCDLSNNYSHHS